MEPALTSIARAGYGKAAVGVYRIGEGLFAAEVAVEVFADALVASYTEGDNALVVPTDTMKNVVHATALEEEPESLERFVGLLAERFLARYGHLERVAVRARELAFAPRAGAAFQRLYDDYGTAELTLGRDGVLAHRSGREALHLLTLGGSSFTGFLRDELTTLPEMEDRPLFVHLDTHWRHRDSEQPVASTAVRDLLVETFAGFRSCSIQHLVHELGQRLLGRFPELVEVSFAAENRLWDAVRTDAQATVYTDARPPFGTIALTLTR